MCVCVCAKATDEACFVYFMLCLLIVFLLICSLFYTKINKQNTNVRLVHILCVYRVAVLYNINLTHKRNELFAELGIENFIKLH